MPASGSAKSVLVLLHQPLFPLYRGDCMRIHGILEALRSEGFELDLLELLESSSSSGAANFDSKLFRAIESHPHTLISRGWLPGEREACPAFPLLAPPETLPPSFRLAAQRRLWNGGYDAVLAANFECLPAALPCPANLALAFCPNDIQSSVAASMLENGLEPGRPPAGCALEEAAMARHCDLLAPVSRRDAKILSAWTSAKAIACPLELEIPKPCSSGMESANALFIGSDSPLNRHALERLLKGIWPLVNGKMPNARLLVAGGVSSRVGSAIPGVSSLGVKASLDEAYALCRVALSPIDFKVGIFVKNLEAMAYGKALVASGASNYGLECPADVFLQADSTEAFADGVVSLLSDGSAALELGKRARAHVARHFGPGRVYPKFARELMRLASSSGAKLNRRAASGKRFAPPAEPQVKPPLNSIQAKLAGILSLARQTGLRRIALYGAGKHSSKILSLCEWGALRPCLILDDAKAGRELDGIKILRPEDVCEGEPQFDLLIISSDAFERELHEKAMKLLPNGKRPVLALYEDFPDN